MSEKKLFGYWLPYFGFRQEPVHPDGFPKDKPPGRFDEMRSFLAFRWGLIGIVMLLRIEKLP